MALTELSQNSLKSEAVNESKIQISNTGTNGQYLQKQSGDTGGLTWADATSTTINNNADNRVITGSGTADTLEGEANLTFDGSTLEVKASAATANDLINAINVNARTTGTAAAGVGTKMTFWGSMTGQDNVELGQIGFHNTNVSGAHGDFIVKTRPNGISQERLRITSGGNVTIPDNGKFVAGGGGDLEIYHDGSHSRITAVNGGTGRLIISGRDSGTAGDIGLQLNADASEEAIICRVDQGVELYYNGSKTFETLEYGAKIKRPSGGETDLEIFGCEGQGANILLAADDGDDNPDKWRFRSSIYGSGHWQFYDGSSWDDAIKVVNGEGVHLHYNGNEKLQTTSAGGTLTGTWTGVGKILQVVSATSGTDDSTTDDWNGSANSNAGTGTALGPTVSITPSSTSSKIIVIWSGGVFLTGGSSSNKIGILGLFNDTSDTQLVTARCGAQLSTSGDDWAQSLTMIGYDSPSSTSAQTYTLVAGRYSGTYPNTIYTNYGMPNDGNDKSVITAMEVA